MPVSEAQKRAAKKWREANAKERYDRLEIFAPKGEKLMYQEHAKLMNESLNGFVNRAMQETMRRDKA